ncbi:hypothetical protein F5Y19DRAFT_265094 [Xylariaceae sp. FL1651]|nr:hypothetical protein F5Y19DRAFT_265094 [Xylariaceae sp. FL1651]
MPRKGFFWDFLSKPKTSKGRDDSRQGRAPPAVVPATPSKSSTSNSLTEAGTSQTAKTCVASTAELPSRHTASPPNPPAPSAREPAATPSAECPHIAAATKSPAPEVAVVPIRSDQLWDRAYDDLKHDTPKLFDLYETILSRDLGGSEDAQGNIIEQGQTERRTQMDRLLDAGLDKTARLVSVEENIGDAIKIILSVKEAIGSALQAVPVAALAWTGVCVALQVFLNPINETTTNRAGIIQVIRTMKWYSSLSNLLLGDASEHDDRFTELRGLLAARILDLYKGLLKYIVKSICAYYQHPALKILRNSVKLDDWTGSMDDVIKAEASVKAAASEYGVRQANSYLGLLVNMHASEAQDEIMQKLCVTDMAAEIESLQKRKDHLLADSYKWILRNKDYQDFIDWHYGNTRRLLWIKGDAGKGKTMLLIGIVRELTAQLETHFDKSYLAYFFCQGTDDRLNTATAILRGLIWMLLHQKKSLIHHLDIFKDLGSTLFEARTAFYNLKKVFHSMLEDPMLERAYLVIDALDECKKEEPGLQQLLDLISETSGKNDKVKWLVSSRNEPDIEAVLEKHTTKTWLCLELNAASVTGAVDAYIDHKMSELAEKYRKAYAKRKDPKFHEKLQRVQDDVSNELRQNADGTFLWVALVFKQIEGCGADKVLGLVKMMPQSLYGIYAQMMRQIDDRDDAADCKEVLLTVVNTYRPLHLSELVTLAGLSDLAVHHDIIRHCGLLTIKEGDEDDEIIYFIHQSAKDYLTKDPNSNASIFPDGCIKGHRTIVSRSLEAMSSTLKRNVYALQYPGIPITDVRAPDPDPLAPVRYACVYWVDHLCEVQTGYEVVLCDKSAYPFLKEHFLYWVEALSLIGSISKGVLAIAKLITLLTRISSMSQLLRLVQDAYRFLLSNRGVIEKNPLQAYVSALIFSPARCLTRELFQDEEPEWIIRKPAMEIDWNACLQTFESHSSSVTSVTYSRDGTRLASASNDNTVKIWDPATGDCLQTLKSHSGWVNSVTYSPNGTRLASASNDKTVKIWDPATGDCLQTLKSHSDWVKSVTYSPNGTRLASASDDDTVKIWDPATGNCLQTLRGHHGWVTSVTYSPNGTRLASASGDDTVKIWDPAKGNCLQTLESHNGWVNSVTYSPNGTRLASASDDKTVKIWDPATGDCLQTLKGHNGWVTSITYLRDSTRLTSASSGKTVKLWDPATGNCLQTLEGHNSWVTLITHSHESTRLASVSSDKTVKIWDPATGDCLQTLEVRGLPARLSFDTTSSCLHTDIGTILLDLPSTPDTALTQPLPQTPSYQGYTISRDSMWLARNGHNVLWLPTEYRPSCSAVVESVSALGVALGCRSGRVLVFQFSVKDG